MRLRNLTEMETKIVYACLKCVADGKVILHDSEFQPIFGIELEDFLDIYTKWPDVNEDDENVQLAISNSMNNLLGYPHGKHEYWDEVMDVSLQEIASVFQKWRGGNVTSYFEGLG